MLIPDTIQSVDRIIELRQQQIKLLLELRQMLALAEAAKVHPRDIERGGYDPETDERFKKWPANYKNKILPKANYLILKDGSRVNIPIDWEAELADIRLLFKA